MDLILNYTKMDFKKEISQGIPKILPPLKEYDLSVNHAPIRENILSDEEKKLSLQNALRYFDKKHHKKYYDNNWNRKIQVFDPASLSSKKKKNNIIIEKIK